MTLPNFLIIGAPKAGSTTLYHYLNEHPEVFMSPYKEPCFFSYGPEGPPRMDSAHARRYAHAVRQVDDYRRLFSDVRDEKAVGEASVSYLAAEGAAERIRATLPEARLIAILRDPVERAYSAYWMDVRNGYETRPFADTIAEGLAEDDATRRYVLEGLYHEHLTKYYALFPREQIRVYLQDDLRSKPVETIQDIYGFLGVDASYVPDTSVSHNEGGVSRLATVDRVLAGRWLKPFLPIALSHRARKVAVRLRRWNRGSTPPLDRDCRRRLESLFRDDIGRLQLLLGRDLSRWMSSTRTALVA